LELEDFIDSLANGDSGDAEISGLSWALRFAAELLDAGSLAKLNAKLPEILRDAR